MPRESVPSPDSRALEALHVGSSGNSADSSSSTNENGAGPAKRKRSRPESGEIVASSSNPRSTRRHSQLDEKPASKPAPKKASTSSKVGSAPSSRPRARPPAATEDPVKAWTDSNDRQAAESRERPTHGRGTRLAAPIVGRLTDVLRDPAVMSVSGGFDYIAGR